MLIGIDTESTHDGQPYSVQWSTADCAAEMRVLSGRWRELPFKSYKGISVVFHNAAHDLEVLRSIGIDLEAADWHDTMLAARILGEPGGLKPLATRLLGVPMQDYDDVIALAKARAWAAWLKKLVAQRCASWGVKTGKGWALSTHVKALANARTKAAVNDEPFDIAERWQSSNMPEGYRKKVRKAVGPDPVVDLRDVDEADRVAYGCQDADVTRRLWPLLEPRLKAEGSWAAYETDRAMVPVLGRIRTVGTLIDRDRLRVLELDMERELDRLHTAMTTTVEHDFSPSSLVDVAKILFDELGQPARRLTQGGRPSTENKQIEALRNRLLGDKAERGGLDDRDQRALDFLGALVEYRHISKLKSTNVTGLWEFIDSGGRVHPDLRMEASSGRCVAGGRDQLGRETPNALAIPRRTAWGKRVRQCYVADEGCVFVVADLSQIEMRVMADLSGDENMIAILSDPERNIHKETAVYIFNTRSGKHPDLTASTVKRPMTDSASAFSFYDAGKTLGFGMLFGLTEWGGQQQFAKVGVMVGREEVADWIEGWGDFFPGVREYRESVWIDTRARGYSVTPLGRRRYLPSIWSPFDRDRAEAERQAVNHPVQGGAIEQAKRWVAAIHQTAKGYRQRGYQVEIVLTVHDETDLVVEEAIADEVARRCVELAKETIKLGVPVGAEASTGLTWGDAK